MQQHHLSSANLPLELTDNLVQLNPHWAGKPGPLTPRFRRWVFKRLWRLLTSGLTPATVLRGPRRVGKTVLLRQLMENLLAEGVAAARILYVPFDDIPSLRGVTDPILAIARWFETSSLGLSFNESARAGRIAYILLDEVQNLDVAHFPTRGAEPEVDFVLTVGLYRIPIEVKYRRRIDPHEDTRGLRAFLEKTVYNAPFGLLVTLEDNVIVPDPRIVPISLSSLMWLR